MEDCAVARWNCVVRSWTILQCRTHRQAHQLWMALQEQRQQQKQWWQLQAWCGPANFDSVSASHTAIVTWWTSFLAPLTKAIAGDRQLAILFRRSNSSPPLSSPSSPSLPLFSFVRSHSLSTLCSLRSRPLLRLGERLSSPNGSPAKRILAHFRRKFEPFWLPDNQSINLSFAMFIFH